MADSISITISKDGISRKMNQMLMRGNLTSGWLNRVAYPKIIEAQRMRWASENATEGGSWRALNAGYAIQKLKRFASFPGGGRKMLIATGRLVDSVTGDNKQDHFKLVTQNRLETGTRVDYAKYVAEDRPFTAFGQNTIKDLTDSLNAYIRGN